MFVFKTTAFGSHSIQDGSSTDSFFQKFFYPYKELEMSQKMFDAFYPLTNL